MLSEEADGKMAKHITLCETSARIDELSKMLEAITIKQPLPNPTIAIIQRQLSDRIRELEETL